MSLHFLQQRFKPKQNYFQTLQENYQHIIDGCKNKDAKAQERLYKDYYRAMMMLCLRYTKNENDAVEVLNNGFLKVFNNIQRYDPGQATLYTWIRTIVINSCLDFIKAKSQVNLHHELDESVVVHIPADAISRMKAAEILHLVRQLPPATQSVFNLYVMEGYNHKEISQMLQISEGTSKWHLSEARKTLQQLIHKQNLYV